MGGTFVLEFGLENGDADVEGCGGGCGPIDAGGGGCWVGGRVEVMVRHADVTARFCWRSKVGGEDDSYDDMVAMLVKL